MTGPSSTDSKICNQRVSRTENSAAQISQPNAAAIAKVRPLNSSAEPSTNRATKGNATTTIAPIDAAMYPGIAAFGRDGRVAM